MAQVTIYINKDLEEKIKTRASTINVSLSKFISTILEQQFNNQWHPDTKQLAGSWKDDFPDLEDIRKISTADIEREAF